MRRRVYPETSPIGKQLRRFAQSKPRFPLAAAERRTYLRICMNDRATETSRSEPWEIPETAIEKVADGSWGIAVSGGADSVALLRLLHARSLIKPGPRGELGPRLALQVVHVNHQARGEASDGDAQ